ncbi:hypothetical protein TNCV_3518441 [Trichonephila clavipes]|uniref:Uncharacterized protein n=1 Tax=Trichonephila clavipes TaxID=2585209 RepID=A0A8X6SPG6_TRICX|nr:hypothetical protein TNCV_3518441 [Trichonephila clavipes]
MLPTPGFCFDLASTPFPRKFFPSSKRGAGGGGSFQDCSPRRKKEREKKYGEHRREKEEGGKSFPDGGKEGKILSGEVCLDRMASLQEVEVVTWFIELKSVTYEQRKF